MRRGGCRVISHHMISLRYSMISYYLTCNRRCVNRSRFQISLKCLRTGEKQIPYPTSVANRLHEWICLTFFTVPNKYLFDPYCMNQKWFLPRHHTIHEVGSKHKLNYSLWSLVIPDVVKWFAHPSILIELFTMITMTMGSTQTNFIVEHTCNYWNTLGPWLHTCSSLADPMVYVYFACVIVRGEDVYLDKMWEYIIFPESCWIKHCLTSC